MFRTHDKNMAGIPGMFGEGLAHWHEISRVLSAHWYHVVLSTYEEGRWRQQVCFLNDERGLQQQLIDQNASQYVEYVQINTPPYMNGSDAWKLEAVEAVAVGEDAHGCFTVLITVEGGATYHTSHAGDFKKATLKNLADVFTPSHIQRPSN